MMNKRYIIILALLLGILFAYKAILSSTILIANAKIFSQEEAKALGIEVDMKTDTVLEILGAPKRTEQSNGPTDSLIFYYNFGEVHFDQLDDTTYTVSQIFINTPNYLGPRNIKVNDNIETVLSKFPYKNNAVITSGEKFIYGNSGSNCGRIIYDKNNKIDFITYSYGGEGFGTFYLSIKVENNKVKTIRIGVMNI